MLRRFLILAALWSAFPVLAADVQPSAPVQQSVTQLRSDVAALRGAVSRSADPQAVIAASLPTLRDRARAASIETTAYEQRVKTQRDSAAFKALKAKVAYAGSLVERLAAPITGEAQRYIALLTEILAALEVEVDRLMTEISRMATEDQQELERLKGACTQACVLPHANSGCAEGQCVIASCHPGWADDDGKAASGCEAPARR